ncbi:MAG TPA: GDSL-type esterase/lipase family protein [Pirellulales bacterium]|nr:GDSL-type esterase/lipase family protein [Pirellulales bacterium]
MRPQLRNRRRGDRPVERTSGPACRVEGLEAREMLSGQTPVITDPIPYSVAYVDAVYRDALGTAPDAAVLNWGVQALDNGQPLLMIPMSAVGNPAYAINLVQADYQQYLGRNADPSALNFWVTALHAGFRDEQLVAALVASDEFYLRAGGTDADWVTAAYQSILGRAPDPTAMTWATSQLAEGVTRGTLAYELAMSPEHENQVVNAEYTRLFQAPPDPGSLSYWASELSQGQTTNELLLMGLMANTTYYQDKTGVPPSVVPVSRNDESAWAGFDAQIDASAASHSNSQVVFFGDSITQLWETVGQSVWNQYYSGLNAVDAGIGGDQTQNLLWRIENGNVNGLAPKVAVLLIGINNLVEGDTPQQTAAGVAAVVEALRERMPDTKILLLGLLPISITSPTWQQEISTTNQLISQLADGQHVTYFDMGPAFRNSDGSPRPELYSDLVHPNTLGFAVWAQTMAPELDALLAAAANEDERLAS